MIRIDKQRMEELREEPAKSGWTCGKNGRGTVGDGNGCAWSGG